MKKPMVSVVMPVYNAEKYLKEAIDSILNQTFTDFEFLIFNDGSKDCSSKIIKSYNDKRIKLFDYKENYGYVKHLNEGIRIAKGKYIARMDADDISLPERFQKQVDFLEKNGDIGLCGTWYKILNTDKEYHTHTGHNKLLVHLFFNNGFGHPTVFIRKSVLTNNNLKYEEQFMPAEDYKLWTKIVNFTKTSNVPEILLHYRVHDTQITVTKKTKQIEQKNQIRLDFLKNLNIDINEEEIVLHFKMLNNNKFKNINSIIKAEKWINKLLLGNKKTRFFDMVLFENNLKSIRTLIISNYFIKSTYNYKVLIELFNINNTFFLKIPFVSVCKIAIKSIVGWKPNN